MKHSRCLALPQANSESAKSRTSSAIRICKLLRNASPVADFNIPVPPTMARTSFNGCPATAFHKGKRHIESEGKQVVITGIVIKVMLTIQSRGNQDSIRMRFLCHFDLLNDNVSLTCLETWKLAFEHTLTKSLHASHSICHLSSARKVWQMILRSCFRCLRKSLVNL